MDRIQEFLIGLPIVFFIVSPVFSIIINIYYPSYIGTIDKYL